MKREQGDDLRRHTKPDERIVSSCDLVDGPARFTLTLADLLCWQKLMNLITRRRFICNLKLNDNRNSCAEGFTELSSANS
jgi:hypothetical protein